MKSRGNLPDPDICRTEHVYNDLYDCLVERKDVCKCRTHLILVIDISADILTGLNSNK